MRERPSLKDRCGVSARLGFRGRLNRNLSASEPRGPEQRQAARSEVSKAGCSTALINAVLRGPGAEVWPSMTGMPDEHERPSRWVVDSEHPAGYSVAMTDDEWTQHRRDQTDARESREAEQAALIETLRVQLDSPDPIEQLKAMPRDEEQAAAALETMRQWMIDHDVDLHESAAFYRAIADEHEAEGTKSSAQMAEWLRASADELERDS